MIQLLLNSSYCWRPKGYECIKKEKAVSGSVEREPCGSRIDAANFAEKIGIIENSDTLLNIRELRNQIAHEYVRQNLNALFMDVLRYVPELKMVVLNLKKYALRFSK